MRSFVSSMIAVHLIGLCACEPISPDDSTNGFGDTESTTSTEISTNTDHWRPIVSATAWRVGSVSTDLWASHRGDASECDDSDRRVEVGLLEMSTQACGYFDLRQESLVPIVAGDRVRIRVFWEQLIFESPAVAHVALALDTTIVWEEMVDIPGPSDVRTIEWIAPQDFPIGSEVRLHLHNHGYNNYRLYDFSVLSSSAAIDSDLTE